MCGICGVVNLDGGPVETGHIRAMAGMIRHRGPDESGVFVASSVGLGHTRLSIIDPACGHQPMHNEREDLVIVFNGEIFNYIELRHELEKRGHRFLTRSDTEVILRLYEEEGDDCVQHFNGQWAFAIWDKKRRRLFLSRDRMGIRPLFYARQGKHFVFGSEIKAIFAHPGIRRELDLIGLDQVFTFWCTLSPRTVFQEIEELPPGHSLVVEAGQLRSNPYWKLEYDGTADDLSEDEWATRLRDLLTDATRIRLRSDVPVGAYLSGGLDSTVVTSLIRRFRNTPLKTFSVVFEDSQFDERKYQQEAVQFLGTDHCETNISEGNIARVFPQVVWHAEQPILRSAPAPLYLLSSLVRSHGYKVVLSGEGADEILGGYDIYKEAKIRRFWGRQPQSKLRPLLLKRLYPYSGNLQAQPESYLQAFFHVTPRDLSSPFFSHLPRWSLTARIKQFFSRDVRAGLKDYNALEEMRERLPQDFGCWDSFIQAQYLETSALLPGYILSSQGDRMSLAHSVEGRFPFLDYRVVQFAARIPPRLKMKVLNEKYILKRAASELVPAIVKARPKQPYRAPDAASFFEGGRYREPYLEALLDPAGIREARLFDPQPVERLLAKVRAGRAIGAKDNMALLGILSTQLIAEQFTNGAWNG